MPPKTVVQSFVVILVVFEFIFIAYVLIYIAAFYCNIVHGYRHCTSKIRKNLRRIFIVFVSTISLLFGIVCIWLLSYGSFMGAFVTLVVWGLILAIPTFNHIFVEKHTLWFGFILYSLLTYFFAVLILQGFIELMLLTVEEQHRDAQLNISAFQRKKP